MHEEALKGRIFSFPSLSHIRAVIYTNFIKKDSFSSSVCLMCYIEAMCSFNNLFYILKYVIKYTYLFYTH